MPTVLRQNGFRFFFFSDEHTPKHIHIEKGEMYVRIELESLKVTDSYNINMKDIKLLQKVVKENKEVFIGAWDEYFKEQ
jgi:hypothetical protein